MNDKHQPFQRSEKQSIALRRFGISITLLTIIGHLFLGFEQSYAQPIIAMVTGYTMALLMEYLYAQTHDLTPRFRGGLGKLVDFLMPVHISSLSIAMLLYFNNRLWIVAFATALAVASKTLFRVPVSKGSRHFLNPSNFAISATFLLFPSVALTMPWQWTAELNGIGNWILPILVFCSGFLLHIKFASRIWVVLSFLVGFVVQAVLRSLFTDINLIAALSPATGVPALIFTFYMAPDPATSPSSRWGQIAFGAAIPAVYMVLMLLHIVFALFYALTIVCIGRGCWMAYVAITRKASEVETPAVAT